MEDKEIRFFLSANVTEVSVISLSLHKETVKCHKLSSDQKD